MITEVKAKNKEKLICPKCGVGEYELRKREYICKGALRAHIGAYCMNCESLIKWVKQRRKSYEPKPATDKQIRYLRALGYTGSVSLERKEASRLIDRYISSEVKH